MINQLKQTGSVLKESALGWSEDGAASLGAALAYYSLFSLGPILFLSLSIAALFFDKEAVSSLVFDKIGLVIGSTGAEGLNVILEKIKYGDAKGISRLVGIGTLAITSTFVIVQLKDSFNTIWGVAPDEDRSLTFFIRKYLISIAAVIGLGFLLLISMVLTSSVAAASDVIASWIPLGESQLISLNVGIDFLVITLVFALMFKYLPDVQLAFKDVFVGALFTTVLFLLGKYLIGLYLGTRGFDSSYGAASSIVLLMAWIYYSSQILLFGAEFTKVYVNRFGEGMEPDPGVHLQSVRQQ